jgi:hypothetical protein
MRPGGATTVVTALVLIAAGWLTVSHFLPHTPSPGAPHPDVDPGRSHLAPPNAEPPRPIRIAMSAAFVSEKGTEVYEKICRYVAARTGHPCDFITGLSYSTIDEMLRPSTSRSSAGCPTSSTRSDRSRGRNSSRHR